MIFIGLSSFLTNARNRWVWTSRTADSFTSLLSPPTCTVGAIATNIVITTFRKRPSSPLERSAAEMLLVLRVKFYVISVQSLLVSPKLWVGNCRILTGGWLSRRSQPHNKEMRSSGSAVAEVGSLGYITAKEACLRQVFWTSGRGL